MHKVVSLEGDVVNVGGSLTGGSFNRQKSSIVQKRELEQVAVTLEQQEKELGLKRNEHTSFDNEIKEVSHALIQKQMAYAKLVLLFK